ncbi:hypothetical protein AOB46_22635 [Chryseobacterium indologenes]|uniref:Uncharacterized protein n=1 Tax=Chryseobacterium indologenes TaxID=253 RepID=A0A0N0ZU70_CHRID|nr:hypothetical protein AOB46_22635 [Chryseobacterium indologenes]
MSRPGKTTYSQFSSNGMSAWANYESLPFGEASRLYSWIDRGGSGYYQTIRLSSMVLEDVQIGDLQHFRVRKYIWRNKSYDTWLIAKALSTQRKRK